MSVIGDEFFENQKNLHFLTLVCHFQKSLNFHFFKILEICPFFRCFLSWFLLKGRFWEFYLIFSYAKWFSQFFLQLNKPGPTASHSLKLIHWHQQQQQNPTMYTTTTGHMVLQNFKPNCVKTGNNNQHYGESGMYLL